MRPSTYPCRQSGRHTFRWTCPRSVSLVHTGPSSRDEARSTRWLRTRALLRTIEESCPWMPTETGLLFRTAMPASRMSGTCGGVVRRPIGLWHHARCRFRPQSAFSPPRGGVLRRAWRRVDSVRRPIRPARTRALLLHSRQHDSQHDHHTPRGAERLVTGTAMTRTSARSRTIGGRLRGIRAQPSQASTRSTGCGSI